jgi:hypothetical protein
MIQTQKVPRKQAIRRRMHSGIVDSSKNCADLEPDGYSMFDASR